MTKRRLETNAAAVMTQMRELREAGKPWRHLQKDLDRRLDRLIIEHFGRGVHAAPCGRCN